MCGIVGIINKTKQPVELQSLHKMMRAIKHRGPDDEGTYIDRNVGLGFVRLSILDTSMAGHQPMVSGDGSLVLVFNGEIFNYLELKNELSNFYKFKTNTDSEVIIASYLKWGEECIEHFIGMWAFAIYNTRTKEIFISRDRFGIKPLYYYSDTEQFYFASDIPALLALMNIPPEPNELVIHDFLMYNRTDYSEETFFSGIQKLRHGHNLKIANGSFTITKWYDLREQTLNSIGFSDPVRDFRDLFIDSVRIHNRSDVPVGICLSGGLDSSSILSVILKEKMMPEITSYSSVFGRGKIGDESGFIDLYDSNEVNKIFAFPTENSLYNDLEIFCDAMVEPIPGTSCYAEFKVMEAAKGKSTVLHSGQGVDEMLAGYHYFFGIYFRQLFVEKKFSKLAKELFYYSTIHGLSTGLLSYIYLNMPKSFQQKLTANKRVILNRDFTNKFKGESKISEFLYGQDNLRESFFNHFDRKFEHHLNWSDKSGMHFSIEARFPFLHHKLVEKTLKVNYDMVINSGVNKVLLRDSMKGYLPEKIRLRMDKVGYETPEVEWFNGNKFRTLFLDIVNFGKIKSKGYFDLPEINNILKKSRMTSNDTKELWKMLSLEYFFNKWYNGGL
jgi:asparagine synthase (glutamine-hydrolysing)